MIEQAKFTYFPLGIALEKQTKKTDNQCKKQIKAIENHGKQLLESNEFIKMDFNIDRDSIPLEEQNNNNNELAEERPSVFKNLDKKN